MWGLAFLLLWIKGNQACWKVHGQGTSAPLMGLFMTARVRFPAPAVGARGFPGLGLTGRTPGEWQVGPSWFLQFPCPWAPGGSQDRSPCLQQEADTSPGGGQGRLPSFRSPSYTPALAVHTAWRSEKRPNFLIFPSSSKSRGPDFQSGDGQCLVIPNFTISCKQHQ